MSTSNGEAPKSKVSTAKSGAFPWMPVIAVAGVAAAAFFLMKRLQADEDGSIAIEKTLDQCDRAASQLDARIRGYSEDLLAS